MSSNLIVNNIEVGAGATIYTAASNQLAFGTNGSEKVRINSGGQTLINQTSALDGAVMLGVKNPTSTDTVVDVVCGSTSHGSHVAFSDTAYARGLISYNHANNFLAFRTNGDAFDKLHITSAGKVGINTTNPSDLLTIVHSANTDDGISIVNTNNSQASAIAQLELSAGDNSHARVQFECNGKYSTIRHDGNGHLDFYTNGSNERLRIESSGAMRLKSEYLRFQAGDHQVSDFSQKVGLKWTYETDIEIAKIEVSRPSWSGGPSDILFHTCNTSGTVAEKLRITSAGILKCGTSAVLKAEINNAVSGHQFISQCSDNNTGFEIYQQHGTTSSRNTLGVYDNRTGSKKPTFVVRGDGHLILDTTSNGYGGLKIYDDSSGDYNVRYIAGRNQSATSHVFMRSGRTQNQSPWADATPAEHARITRGGIAFHGDTADNNTLNDYEEGTFVPSVSSGLAAGQISYNSRSGNYTKIGNVVTFTLHMNISSCSLDAGALKFGGLPKTAINDTHKAGGCYLTMSNGNMGTDKTYRVVPNSTDIQVITAAGDAFAANSSSLNAGNRALSIHGSYYTDAL